MKFLGVKARPSTDLTEEEKWERILGGNFYPVHCPRCNHTLTFESAKCQIYYPAPWLQKKGIETCTLELYCQRCNLVTSFFGEGIIFSGDGFGLGEVSIKHSGEEFER